MAIRSTNSDRPSKAMSGTGNRGRENRDGPGNKPVDYGQRPPGSQSMKDRIDRRREEYGDSPWLGRDGKPMPWSGPPGQQRGQRAPMFTPDAGNPANAGYFKNQSTADELAAEMLAAKERYGNTRDLLMDDPAYAAAKAAGDLRGQIAAMMALRGNMQQQRFEDQGGTAETWKNRFKTEWPVPKPAPGKGSTSNPNGKPDVSRETTGRTGGAGGIQGYIPTEDMPPGMTLDIPSNNILSALGSLKPPAKKPTGVRRGGGRVD